MLRKTKHTLPVLPLDGNLYYNEQLCTLEALIVSNGSSIHAADLIELPNKDLLAVWFAGTKEGDANIRIEMSRLKAGEQTWEEAVWLTNDTKRSEQNPSLFMHPDGTLWLIYTAQLGREYKEAHQLNLQCTAEIRVMKSNDLGNTWSNYEVLFEQPGSFCRQKPQILSNGRMVFGNWLCLNDDTHYGTDTTVVQISDDNGKTWKASLIEDSRGCVHANLIEVENGKLIALFRSRSADYIYISKSNDYGDTWSAPVKTELPNNNSSISAVKLQSGKIAIIYNDYSANLDREKVVWPYERCPVAIALSEDGGETWPYRRYVETGENFFGEKNTRCNRKYEYPVIMQGDDGIIHAAYSFGSRICVKYVALDENWIIGQKPEERD